METCERSGQRAPVMEKKEYGVLLALAFLALGLVFLGSDTTSPLFQTDPYRIVSADPSTFILIGRYWLTEGCVPYTALFDQKGPVIFLLNGIGWLLTDSAHGICAIQSLFLFSYLALAYKSCRDCFDWRRSFCTTVFSFVVLTLLYGIGDTVEEFNLPFMMLCLMGFLRYSRRRAAETEAEHDPRWAFVYGLGTAFFLLNRPTDAGPVGIGVLVIGIDLLLRGKIRNFWRNILAGLLGLFVLILPFLLYFAQKDALTEFWFGTIGYNMVYASKDVAYWLKEMTWKSTIKLFFYCLPILGTLAAGILALFKKQGVRAALWIGIAVYALLFYSLSRGYTHYLVSFAPLTVPAACELDALSPPRDEKQRRRRAWMRTAVFTVVILLNLVQGRKYFTDSPFFWKTPQQETGEVLVAEIPADDRNEVLFLDCLSSLYLITDIRPCCRFFAFQSWQASFSSEMAERITGEFAEGKAKWVLSLDGAIPPLRQILDSQYRVYDTKGRYILYTRIESP